MGAHYLLTMLVGAEARGLPGTVIDRVEFQRAPEGRALDDVIIHAHDALGRPSVLEVQVKRALTFAPADPVFREVVGQIAKACQRQDFWTMRYELAIATAKSSRKIDGAYQDVLRWARAVGSAEVFFQRLGRKGSANDDMRALVDTFRAHLEDAGVTSDDNTVWRLLGRLWILTFDFTVEGSASENLAIERSVRALHPEDSPRARALWMDLVELAIRIAAVGGDSTLAELTRELTSRSFRLAGQRRFTSARAVVAESSRNALDDIGVLVGEATLSRTTRLAELRTALDRGRYLEIQGDAGVGKSGLLKAMAEQGATEASIIVLSPGRIPLRGWSAMRAEIGFDGSARELLVDMAGDGAGAIFLDNIDQLTPDERNTVTDLIRAASETPGMSVVSTARRPSSPEDRSWLPAAALERLGHAGPIIVGELDDAEIAELRLAAPALAGLLSDAHPARAVVRNLYRLGRLAGRPATEPSPRTEVDMAVQWWETADGERDADYRDRSRILRTFARQAFAGSGPLDGADQPARALSQLVSSETLRDLQGDRFTFRHDVLRDWALANLLSEDSAAIESLPLHLPAPAALARGTELYARMAIERSGDSTSWQLVLDRLSRAGVHGSWRRAALLALVRSEIASDLLTRAFGYLAADNAAVLRELIRTTMAVDSVPAAQFLGALGMDPAAIPAGLNVPSGPSWGRLILWLLSLGARLPVAATPDTIELYTMWSTGMIGMDPLTPMLLERLHQWLIQIERDRLPFGGGIGFERTHEIESSLRSGFLAFCRRTPDLAADYLRTVRANPHNDRIADSIIKFRGTLAEAAPAELAELTAASLIRQQTSEQHHHRYDRNEPFSFLDHQLLPESPAQGPFYELLTHAPRHGLGLVRRLVDHAITFNANGKPDGSNAIVVNFDDGARTFPWIHTYNWSRSSSCNYYCVTSALMALEAWAHKRIENGEDFNVVLGDVLGAPASPAACLLVAVDLVISHWPKSAEAAVPFLGSPVLLSIDRERHMHDQMPFPDFFGLGALQKEPTGAATLTSLERRPSRQHALEALLKFYAFNLPVTLREKLRRLLQAEADRLGEPAADADMRDPALMVRYALNVIDPANWVEVDVAQSDGTTARARQYVAPAAEANHLATLREVRAGSIVDGGIEAQLGLALDDPTKSSPELLRTGIDWARRQPAPASAEWGEDDLRVSNVVTAAMIAMRDGDPDLLKGNRRWADEIFGAALRGKQDAAHRIRDGLRFNPPAIAFAGMVHALKGGLRPGDIRAMLEAAAQPNPAAAHGFGSVAAQIAAVDERLPRSLLRCAFAAAIRTRSRWDAPEAEAVDYANRYHEQCAAAVSAELAWLDGAGPEPPWPMFTSDAPPTRRRIRLPGSPEVRTPRPAPRRDEYTDYQAAALWLTNCRALFDAKKRPWLIDLVRAYSEWTATVNGAGLAAGEDVARTPTEWNEAYFGALANCLPGMTSSQIDELAFDPMRSLPDEPFLDVLATFVVDVDRVFFNDRGLTAEEAVRIRSKLAERLVETSGWRSMIRRRSNSIEMHLAPAAAAMFFNNHGFTQPATAYLLPKGIDRLRPFLPLLKRLATDAPCPFVAIVTLNLLEVSPRVEHAALLVAATKSWAAAFPGSSEFWVDHRIGRRICALLDTMLVKTGALFGAQRTLRPDVDAILAALVPSGVSDAARLEKGIAGDGTADV